MDEDGYITLVDRKKDMILCGGHNVFPRKIEEAIHQHAAVAEVAVVGIPDPHLGVTPKAYVVLRAGCRFFSEADLQAFLADKLARHEIPKRVEVRQSLPKSATGKISKKALLASEEAAHH
jgi:long-chain acyl-CoA synthetase